MNLMSKIKSRLGGELYTRIRALSKYEREFTRGNEYSLEFALLGVSKFLKTKFLFGSKIAAKAEKDFYTKLRTILCRTYASTINSDFYDFNGIILPKFSTNEWSTEREFCNMLAYYVLENKRLAEAITEEPYEYGNVQIENEDVVIDCGANLGAFSAIANYKGAAIVCAFEPNQVVIDRLLSATATLNPKIHICNYALSNKKEEVELAFDYNHLDAGTLSFVNPSLTAQKSVTTTVSAVTLDEFVRENKLERVDFIKADIEGAERYMLMGAKQVLKEFAPKLAICTYHLPDDPKVLREIILEANPNYVIEEKYKKLYAYVPR